ncbi:MAG: SDR family NAD(P)-dependent oxidoreductase [Microbacterium sp.]|uniref:SDR family NAD(P)-dependent oxidoreductase n=1 Tax=Microbacterium sp. TaxID=51671 RepID=UPI001D68BA22|nr:SDR family NAD(P)-dependent oxidoreductase [Microbacterium sp.]MBW8763279.1 SDR family NAD(P)-dependent oxidoreductase [Microbacterium sp.]
MSATLAGRHILVTGGGSGIARAAAERYDREGAIVTVLNRSVTGAAAVREASGGRIRTLVGDGTELDTLRTAVAAAVDGDGRLDNLTCGIGVFDDRCRISDLAGEELLVAAEESWRVNVRATLLAVNAAVPALRAAHGSITLTLSESAFAATGGGVLYGSSKWALRGVVDHLAAELAPDIRVNGVAPGGTGGTRFGGLSSLGQTRTADQVDGRNERIAAGTLLGITAMPEDHAGAYRFLADPVDAKVVTGVVIRTDGGRRL